MKSEKKVSFDDQLIARLIARNRRVGFMFLLVSWLALLLGMASFMALTIDMLWTGWDRLTFDFFSSFPSRRATSAGILPAWVGSLLVMTVTSLFAIPLGVATGVYLEEYAPKGIVTDIIEINISNLAGVPSIVYGLLALGLFVYKFGFGHSILSAGLVLALLILPTIVVSTREAIRGIPQHIREGAYGLGATRWQVVKHHVVPYSLPGILTGIILGLSRAIGETAPIITIGALTFVAFLPPSPLSVEPPFLSFAWLWSDFTVMPIQMFNWTSRPSADFHANAAAAGIVLVGMTVSMNALAIYIRYRLRRNLKW